MKQALLQSSISEYKAFLSSGGEEQSGGSFAERESRVRFYQSLTKERVLSMDEEEVRSILNGLWANYYRDEASKILAQTKLETVKAGIADLLFGDGGVAERWDRVDKLGIYRFGRGKKAEMLAFRFPSECANCDSRDLDIIMDFEPSAKRFGSKITGQQYVEYCQLVESVRLALKQAGCKADTLVDADRFIFFLSDAKDNGGKKRKDKPKPSPSGKRFWFVVCRKDLWDPREEPVGATVKFGKYHDTEHLKPKKHQSAFQNARIGESVVFYIESHVVSVGKVISEDDGDCVGFEITAQFQRLVSRAELQKNPKCASVAPIRNPQGTLFEISEAEYNAICALGILGREEPAHETRPSQAFTPYTDQDFLADVYVGEEALGTLKKVVSDKLNVILQGPPGVGKTYAAKRLAYVLMGEMDESRIKMIQFHQSYAYEDFVQGYKPDGNGFELRNGPFFEFCAIAAADPSREYFFIIDEINRGNISKIFGELLMLIEKSHRGPSEAINLVYSPNMKPFFVPDNLYIIGLMNTADRSLALMDYALRRRFSFLTLEPAFETGNSTFMRYVDGLNWPLLNRLVALIKRLNKDIADYPSLGADYQIGHSYFCGFKRPDDDALKAVILYDIIPMIREYWNDDKETSEGWVANLTKALE